ncbi:MAG: glutathione S-transferase family protein [Deltaproteobacteria bacterium]|nr:glutathione S-transferase family protein [Deltaproteobacteria bacterium]
MSYPDAMPVPGPHQLIAAEVSLFSGKARAYLRYKEIPFEEVQCTREVIETVVRPRTGLRMVPVLITDEDVAVQDTTAIIDCCEARVTTRGVYPPTPRQRLAALLLEVYGDEWLLLPAMHYRWHYKRANLRFIMREFGQLIAPRLPAVLHPLAGLPLVAYFGGAYGPVLGVTRHNRQAIEHWYQAFLRAFDAHLAEHRYLLGDRPSVGDFGLMGPLYAHLYRDPYPGRMMRTTAPRVARWVERMNDPPATIGQWCADDEVPPTLDPIFRMLFDEMWPVVEQTVALVREWVRDHPDRSRMSRFVGRHGFSIGGSRATRRAQSFTQWMVQRPLTHYRGCSTSERDAMDTWLSRVGGRDAMQLQVPVWLERRDDNRLYPAAEPSQASG